MTQTDVEFAVTLAKNENWTSENHDVFRAFLFHDPKGCLIAEIDRQPVGLCIATAYRQSGYFGELIVTPDHRKQGIGARLLESAMEYLKNKGIRTIYLDAVPEAVPLYERYGFKKICKSFRFSGFLKGREQAQVRAMRKWDLDPVCKVDEIAFGDDRHFFLKWISFIGPDFAKVLTENETIIGFISGRYTANGISVGPWIMPPDVNNPEALLLSLADEVLQEPLHLGVLETNQKSITLLKSLGFKLKSNSPVHMAWGEKTGLGTSESCFAIGSPAKG